MLFGLLLASADILAGPTPDTRYVLEDSFFYLDGWACEHNDCEKLRRILPDSLLFVQSGLGQLLDVQYEIGGCPSWRCTRTPPPPPPPAARS